MIEKHFGTKHSDVFDSTHFPERVIGRRGDDTLRSDNGTHHGDVFLGGAGNDSWAIRSYYNIWNGAGIAFDGGTGTDTFIAKIKGRKELALDLEYGAISHDFSIGNVKLNNIENLHLEAKNVVLDLKLKLTDPIVPTMPDTVLTSGVFTSYTKHGKFTPESSIELDFSGVGKTSKGDGLYLSQWGNSISYGEQKNHTALGHLQVGAEFVGITGTDYDDTFRYLLGKNVEYKGRGGDDYFDIVSTGLKAGGNVLSGGKGDDWLYSIEYGSGVNRSKDFYNGGTGNDVFVVEDKSFSVFDGGKGFDIALIHETARIDLQDQTQNGGSAKKQEFNNIESFRIASGSTFRGDSDRNNVTVISEPGTDDDITIVRTIGGADHITVNIGLLLQPYAHNVFVFGGTGRDTLELLNSRFTFEATFDLLNQHSNSGLGEKIVARGIENITGGTPNDIISGDNKANTLKGMAGDDVLSGRGGRDRLIGGDGNDDLTGGSGKDVFVFVKDRSTDVVRDFVVGIDTLSIESKLAQGITSSEKLVSNFVTINDGHAEFDFGVRGQIILNGISSVEGLAESIIIV